jgi:hypothetical protein
MVLPLQVTFRNLEHSGRIEQEVQREAAKLEKFYNRIISCRVVVEAPERHHQHGNLHHVRVDLGLPGTELVVKDEPSLLRSGPVPTPHRDVDVAIRGAFRAARRQLQDYARRQRGDVKTHGRLPA